MNSPAAALKWPKMLGGTSAKKPTESNQVGGYIMAHAGHQNLLSLILSDQMILNVLGRSNEFIANDATTQKTIESRLWAFRSLHDLVPETSDKLFSGHTFPIFEAQYELESSVALC